MELIDPKILGRRLRQERERLGLTQTDLAEIAGVRRITVYQYEKGDRRASLDFLLSVEHVGVSFEYILRGERPKSVEITRYIDAQVASELFDLVDRYAVDKKGRALHRDSRQTLFDSLVSLTVNLERSQIDRAAINDVLEEFAA